jgi:hypothetical protein
MEITPHPAAQNLKPAKTPDHTTGVGGPAIQPINKKSVSINLAHY